MLILRIRQAEVALSDGRLEEVVELLKSEKLRTHRKGQAIISRLVRKLVARGREHFAAGRAMQALADCERAAKFEANDADVAALRTEAGQAIVARQREQRRAAQAFHAARDHIEAGRLLAGEQLLAGAATESRAALLMQDVNLKRAMVETSIQSAAAALQRDDLDAAAVELARARSCDASDPRVVDLGFRITQAMKQRIAAAIDEGRLDLAESMVGRLIVLDDQGVDAQHLKRSIEQYKLAWEAIDRGRPRQADEILKRLATAHPGARWIRDALKQVAAAEEALESLRSGPLGLFASGKSWLRGDSPTETPGTAPGGAGVQPVQGAQHGLQARATDMPSDLPSKFLIQVDGAGTFCVLRQPTVAIGPLSSSRMPDIGLIADAGAPVATIQRNDDDYFIKSAMVQVNDRPLQSKLLMPGDRIAISPRCRMTFLMPNPASTSAVLDLSGARFPRADVRRIILLDRDIIIGPGNAAHIRCDQLLEPAVLHLRGGRLVCETKSQSQQVLVNGRPMDRAAGIPLGGHVDLGNVSFVITPG